MSIGIETLNQNKMEKKTKKLVEKKYLWHYNTIINKATLKEVSEKFAKGIDCVIVKHELNKSE